MDEVLVGIIRKWQEENCSREPSFITKVQLHKQLLAAVDKSLSELLGKGVVVSHESVNCTMYEVK